MHNHIHSAAYTISSTISYDWVCKNNNPCKNWYFTINILWNWYVFCLRRQTLDPPPPPRRQTWTFWQPPLPPPLSTWFVHSPWQKFTLDKKANNLEKTHFSSTRSQMSHYKIQKMRYIIIDIFAIVDVILSEEERHAINNFEKIFFNKEKNVKNDVSHFCKS